MRVVSTICCLTIVFCFPFIHFLNFSVIGSEGWGLHLILPFTLLLMSVALLSPESAESHNIPALSLLYSLSLGFFHTFVQIRF